MSIVINVLSSLCRCILVSNHLPIRATKQEETGTWEFEWDEDALIYQAQVSLSSSSCMFYVRKLQSREQNPWFLWPTQRL